MSASTPSAANCSASKAASVQATELVFLIICVLVVALRLGVRSIIIRKLWWDDYLVVLAVIFIAITFGLDMAEIANGLGRHIECIPLSELARAQEFLFVSEPILILSAMFARLSFILLLMRVFAITRRRRVLFWSLFGLVFATNIAAACAILPQCNPIPKIWDPTIPGTCWDPSRIISVNYYNGAVSAICDLLLSLVPIYLLWNIQLRLNLKMGICAVLALGLFTAGCTIARTVLYHLNYQSLDPTWDTVQVTIWAVLEGDVAIIAATLPALWPLFSKKARDSHRSNRYEYHSQDRLNRTVQTDFSAGSIRKGRQPPDPFPTDVESYALVTAPSLS